MKSEETKTKVKRGFMRFATKVKNLFKKDEGEAEEEYEEAAFKDAAIHDQAKAELHVSDEDLANEVDSDGEPIPEMLKLDSQTSEENNFEESENWQSKSEKCRR